MNAVRPILVTGAAGLLGRAVVDLLVKGGRPVRALVRPGTASRAPRADEVIEADLDSPRAVLEAVRGVGAIVHTAALMSGPDEAVRRSIVDHTRRLLDLAQENGVGTFVYISSVAVYGHGDFRGIDESHPLAPTSAYGRAKADAERLVQAAYAGRPQKSAWILRPSNVYGPGDRHFATLIETLGRHAVIPLVRGGGVFFDVVAAADVAALTALCLDRPAPGPGETLNASGGEDLTVKDVVDRVRERFGYPCRTVDVQDPKSPPPGVPPELVGLVAEDRRFSIDKARRLVGYRPAMRFPDGMDTPRSTPPGG